MRVSATSSESRWSLDHRSSLDSSPSRSSTRASRSGPPNSAACDVSRPTLLGGDVDEALAVADGGDEVEVADVAGELAHELGEVGALLGELGDPAEEAGDVAVRDEPGDLEERRRVHLAEKPLDVGDADLAAGERGELLECGDRVAHPARRRGAR